MRSVRRMNLCQVNVVFPPIWAAEGLQWKDAITPIGVAKVPSATQAQGIPLAITLTGNTRGDVPQQLALTRKVSSKSGQRGR